MVHVAEAQVRQRLPGAIKILVVPRWGFGIDQEMRLRAEIQKRVGIDMKIDVELVETIVRTASGKLRFVVQELK
jgi:hypothetical protein